MYSLAHSQETNSYYLAAQYSFSWEICVFHNIQFYILVLQLNHYTLSSILKTIQVVDGMNELVLFFSFPFDHLPGSEGYIERYKNT